MLQAGKTHRQGIYPHDQLRTAIVGLHILAGMAILACAAALAPSLPGWWRPLAVAGATCGILAFALF
jgi:hypothetical protein